ncbi:MAG: hypothetical protein AAFX87_01615 [Bacteroidota bacterium]
MFRSKLTYLNIVLFILCLLLASAFFNEKAEVISSNPEQFIAGTFLPQDSTQSDSAQLAVKGDSIFLIIKVESPAPALMAALPADSSQNTGSGEAGSGSQGSETSGGDGASDANGESKDNADGAGSKDGESTDGQAGDEEDGASSGVSLEKFQAEMQRIWDGFKQGLNEYITVSVILFTLLALLAFGIIGALASLVNPIVRAFIKPIQTPVIIALAVLVSFLIYILFGFDALFLVVSETLILIVIVMLVQVLLSPKRRQLP